MLSQLANKPRCLTSSGSLWPQVQATMGMWLRRRRDKGCCARGKEGWRRVGEACLVRASMPAPTGAGVAVEVCNKSREAVFWLGRRDWYKVSKRGSCEPPGAVAKPVGAISHLMELKPGEVERKPTSAPSDIRPCCTCLTIRLWTLCVPTLPNQVHYRE